ncbi:Erg28 protein [Mytilinidion resinicola]|uniref:Erg28 protein n=1 Tax=Mytilinidion resinicola TaxID=574789 RepID=A0A6A6YCA9_9PEZI|nr:Erg28 protein [Mytilinidion resinicola]KAF2805735.1 Erg28 protein [Mytilinidion resinicola]
MDALTAYLPPHEGLLPKWLLLVSAVSVANSIQCYLTTTFTARVYNGPSPPTASKSKSPKPPPSTSPVTPLSSRTFGTWTFLSSVIRLYAAYYTSDPRVYELAFATYAIAWGHFMLEWWVFGTARWGAGLGSPVVVSSTSLVWMWVQWGFYVKG